MRFPVKPSVVQSRRLDLPTTHSIHCGKRQPQTIASPTSSALSRGATELHRRASRDSLNSKISLGRGDSSIMTLPRAETDRRRLEAVRLAETVPGEGHLFYVMRNLRRVSDTILPATRNFSTDFQSVPSARRVFRQWKTSAACPQCWMSPPTAAFGCRTG